MKILALTISDENAASSRLRSFYLFRFAAKYGVEVTRIFNIRNILQSDLLHIQKTIKIKYVVCAILFRLAGRKVIFDFDDQPSSFRLGRNYLGRLMIWCAFAFMILISSHVTTDTPERRRYWERFGFRNILVIPDVVDIDPGISFPQIENTLGQWRTKLVWVGYVSNLHSIHALVEELKIRKEIKLFIITNAATVGEIQRNWPWVEVVPWKKDITLSDEFRLSAMVLNHDSDESAKLKSENKMVLAIASGIIPIVSRTPAYSRLAKEIDAECLLYDDIVSAPAIASLLDQEWVNYFFAKARKYIQASYSAEAVFLKFKCLVIDC